MLLKPLTMAILLATTQPTLAATWSYDFSGNLNDHFTQVTDSPNPSVSGQVNGQFIFHTQGQQYTEINPFTGLAEPADVTEGYIHNTFSPSFNQSWDMQIIATLPSGIDATLPNQPAGADWYSEIGFGVMYFDTQGASYSLTSLLAIGNVQQPLVDRNYNSEFAITPSGGEWTEYLNEQGERNTSDETGMLGMSFDAATKVLSAYNSHETLLSIDLNAPGISNWGMSDSDHFIIFIAGSGAGWAIPENMAYSLDDFSATAQPVPEPETYALMLAGLGLVGFAARRKPLQIHSNGASSC